jgi:hypothetical protein
MAEESAGPGTAEDRAALLRASLALAESTAPSSAAWLYDHDVHATPEESQSGRAGSKVDGGGEAPLLLRQKVAELEAERCDMQAEIELQRMSMLLQKGQKTAPKHANVGASPGARRKAKKTAAGGGDMKKAGAGAGVGGGDGISGWQSDDRGADATRGLAESRSTGVSPHSPATRPSRGAQRSMGGSPARRTAAKAKKQQAGKPLLSSSSSSSSPPSPSSGGGVGVRGGREEVALRAEVECLRAANLSLQEALEAERSEAEAGARAAREASAQVEAGRQRAEAVAAELAQALQLLSGHCAALEAREAERW